MNKPFVQSVIGLNFGDEGKGFVVDKLSARKPNSLVVRFSGGPNAGHRVIRGGQDHIFSTFGSGTFNGCHTALTEDTLFCPISFQIERDVLKGKVEKLGLNLDEIKFYLHPKCPMISPYDIAWNVAENEFKEQGKTCGKGIGATMDRHFHSEYKLYAIDLMDESLLDVKLDSIRGYYREKLSKESSHFFNKFYDTFDKNIDYFTKVIKYVRGTIVFYLNKTSIFLKEFGADNIIFEGSQGLLLDMNYGVHPPYTTYSNLSIENIVKHIDVDEAIYVTRSYLTRHGFGDIFSDNKIETTFKDEQNVTNEFQGEFRIAELNFELIKRSLILEALNFGNNTELCIALNHSKFVDADYLKRVEKELKDITENILILDEWS